MHDIIEQLRRALPPVFLGSLSDELTGGAVHWATIQNKRSRREIPDECFLRSGTRNILVIRDRFLDWWGSTLRPVNQTGVPCPPQPQAGRRGQTCETQQGNLAKE
jgi:hypothetical protein